MGLLTRSGTSGQTEVSKGATYGFAAYVIWGAFPLYFHALEPSGAWEVLVHRILWTFVVCVIVLAYLRKMAFARDLLHNPRRLAAVTIASLMIATNWTIYVEAVVTGHVVEASLGYFLNPLVTVALGVVVLRERLRRLQWIAVGVGIVACIYLAIDYGHLPWISVCLALSFASYGFMKNRIGGSMTPLESLASETAVLTPVAVVVLVALTVTGHTTFTTDGTGHALLLMSSGVATAIPLLLFAAAARRVPLVTIGLLQFITPVLQLLCGVLLLDEHLNTARWIGFGIVWVALALLSLDSLRAGTRSRRQRRLLEVELAAEDCH
ncbi:EamA family transporter RarD [Leekyejoonella antrihumi]|uniref:EamA family transporter RarD n=2 Tax=Leekyejoonella antrihumi TaxID=1660198 RepID=A0A563E4W0_9MICO|nr:EamA family transporter RarD [Leekyejoonella antrihumi]